MAFKKLRIAPITAKASADGYPTYGEFMKLQDTTTSEELNSVEITVSNVSKSKVLNGDDRETEKKVNVRYEGTLKVYDCDHKTALPMFGFRRDANDNVIEVMNSTDKKNFGLFFQGKTSKDVEYQKYFYDVEFDEPTITATTDNGEETATLEIPFKGSYLYTEDAIIRAATVYKDKTGWVTGEPSTMYKEVKAQSQGG